MEEKPPTEQCCETCSYTHTEGLLCFISNQERVVEKLVCHYDPHWIVVLPNHYCAHHQAA